MKKVTFTLIFAFTLNILAAQIIEYDSTYLTAVVTAQRDFYPKSIATPPIPTAAIPFDKFSFSAQQAQQFSLTSGTTIDVPENAFLDKNGELITGDVQLFYREFNNSLDIFLSGIPMTIEMENGLSNLQSAGMFELLAFQEETAVYPNPDAPISVEMNSQTAADDYNLYEFEEAENTWIETGKDEILAPIPIINRTGWGEVPMPQVSTSYVRIQLKNKRYMRYLTGKKGIAFQLDINSGKGRRIKWQTLNENGLYFRKRYHEVQPLEPITWVTEDFDRKAFKEFIYNYHQINWQFHSRFPLRKSTKLNFSSEELIANATRDFLIEPNFEQDNFSLHFISQTDTFTIAAYPYMGTSNAVVTQKRIAKFYKNYQKNLEKRKKEWAAIETYHARNLVNYEAAKEIEVEADQIKDTARSQVDNIIRRRIDVARFGWTNIDRLFKLLDEEILVNVVAPASEEIHPITGIYVLDEKNNAVIYYQGNLIEFVKKSTNSLVVLRADGAVGFVSNASFLNAWTERKNGMISPVIQFDKTEKLDREKIINHLAIN